MSDEQELNRDQALYARWCSENPPQPDAPKLSAMVLAAYVDGRLDQETVEEVETALAEDSFLLTEFLAARRLLPRAVVSDALLDRARRLVPMIGNDAGARIIPFRSAVNGRSAARGFSGVVAWGALAASVLVVSMIGFNLGMATQQAIDQPPGATPVDLLEQVDSAIG